MGQACYKHSDSGYSSDGKYHLTVRIGADDIAMVADRKMQVKEFKEWIMNEQKMNTTSSIRLFFYGAELKDAYRLKDCHGLQNVTSDIVLIGMIYQDTFMPSPSSSRCCCGAF